MFVSYVIKIFKLLLLCLNQTVVVMLKRHKSIGVFVVYTDTGSSMPISPSKSRDLADENKKILTEWKRFETTVFSCDILSVWEKNNISA
jgi:hypothetical protein